jgi:hypothetical protein
VAPPVGPLREPRSLPLAVLIHGVVDQNFRPEWRALFSEFVVNGVDLIRLVSGVVVEDQDQRAGVRTIDDRTVGRSGRACEAMSHALDSRQRANAFPELRALLIGQIWLEPEIDGMNEHIFLSHIFLFGLG